MSQPPQPPDQSKGFFAGLIARARANREATLARKRGLAPVAAVSSKTARPAPTGTPFSFKPAQVAALAVPARSIEAAAPDEPPAIVELKRYAYVRWLIRVLALSVTLNAVVLLMLFYTGLLAGQRPLVQLTARPSLQEEAKEMFGKDTKVNVDDLLLYLNTVLPLMHRIDDRGAPDLPLLRGLIAPEVYEKAAKEAEAQAMLAKKNFVVQSLIVTRIEDVVTNTERGRVSAYVRGYLAIIVQSTNRSFIMPYRAQVLLEMAPPGRLNRFPFVLIKREWRIEQAALDWDIARAKAKAERDSASGADPTLQAIPSK